MMIAENFLQRAGHFAEERGLRAETAQLSAPTEEFQMTFGTVMSQRPAKLALANGYLG